MMRFDKQTLMWTGGVIALTAAFLCGVTRPQIKRMCELKTAIGEERADSATNRTEMELMPRLQHEVDSLTAHIADFDQRIPEQEMLGPFLEVLARSAEEHKLRPDAIEPGAPIRDSGVIGLPIVFKVHGPFKDVYALVKDIEHTPRLTQVERFEVKNTVFDPEAPLGPSTQDRGQLRRDDKPGTVSAELHLRIFSRARTRFNGHEWCEAANLGSVASALPR